MDATAISIEGLVKTFGPTRALDGLDLSVRTGEVHGFLGPTRAGNTTPTPRLVGLARRHPRRRTPSGGAVADLLGGLRGGLNPQRRDTLLELFDLDPRKKARPYSKGNRQKVALIAALASDVELLLLDEPTAGLDPLMEAAFREVIREELQSQRTVLLSSHILAEVEALCERVSIIRAGRIVESATLAELRHLTRPSIQAELAAPPDGLLALPGVHNLEVDGARV